MQNVFINVLAPKGGVRRISILYRMWGQTVTKEEKKAEVLKCLLFFRMKQN